MAYELFDSKAIRLGAPSLTLTRDGRIVLNADAADLLRRAGGKFVHLLWDADALKIALKPLGKADGAAFKLTSKIGKRGMVISGSTFLRHIGWSLSKSARLEAAWNEERKMLEASLPGKFVGR